MATRSTAQRRASGFTPAARVGQRQAANEQEDVQEPSRDTLRVQRGEGNGGEQPLTRFGLPDRRFKGQRDLEHPGIVNPDYRQARQGGEENGRHVTLDGKPDRRFKENRALSDEEVMEQWAETIIARHGPGKTRGR